MRNSLRTLYRAVATRVPVVGRLLRRIRSHEPLFNRIRRRIKGKDNIVRYNGSDLFSVTFDIAGNGNRIEIEPSCVLHSVRFHIRGDNHSIHIGKGCRFNNGGTIWFEDAGGLLDVGDESTFEKVDLAVAEPGSRILIGRDCMFSYDIDVRNADSHSILDAGTNARVNYAADVSFGNHVWVGAHSTILKGACIPDESVIGAGSVVTKQFSETGTIIAGNPAVVVKRGIRWSRRRILRDGAP